MGGEHKSERAAKADGRRVQDRQRQVEGGEGERADAALAGTWFPRSLPGRREPRLCLSSAVLSCPVCCPSALGRGGSLPFPSACAGGSRPAGGAAVTSGHEQPRRCVLVLPTLSAQAPAAVGERGSSRPFRSQRGVGQMKPVRPALQRLQPPRRFHRRPARR
jgi:hypothetical protein